MNYQDIITIEPGKRGGKPCIRGMRITVYDVLSYLASGMSHQEILADFPYLTENDILACLSYAADREHHLMVARDSSSSLTTTSCLGWWNVWRIFTQDRRMSTASDSTGPRTWLFGTPLATKGMPPLAKMPTLVIWALCSAFLPK